MESKIQRRDLFIAFFIILIFWQVLSWIINLPILPTPLIVLGVFTRDIGSGKLTGHFLASFWRVIAGTFLAIITAGPLGIVLGQSKRIGDLLKPFIYLMYPIPKVVFVPIILLFLGIGNFAKIIIIFMILFFQILVLVRDQSTNIRNELIQSVKSLGAGRRALYKFVFLPATYPAILTALRQSIGTAVAVLYIAELFATTKGLGYYIYFEGSTLMDYPAMYAGVLAMSILGLGLYYSIDYLEKWLCPWLITHNK